MSGPRARTMAEGWVPTKHGIPSSYNRGCRCRECRDANAARQRRSPGPANYRKKKYAEREWINGVLVHPNPGKPGHGTITGYTTYGCRCRACSTAMRTHVRARREHGGAVRWERSGPHREIESTPEPPATVDLTRVFEWNR